jgi:hemerythrin-like domain-containing protein
MVDFDTSKGDTSRKKLPLEMTLLDENMILIDEHKNARGNEVLKFRNRSTGETRTYPNVNPSHLPDNLRDRLNQGAVGKSTKGVATAQPSSSSSVPTPRTSSETSGGTVQAQMIPTPQLNNQTPSLEIITDTHLNEPRDGIILLLNDHNMIRQLVAKFDSLLDNEKRRLLVSSLIKEICVHASIEEQLVYPLMRQFLPNGEAIANKFLTDNQNNNLIMHQLEEMNIESDRDLFNETVKNFFMNEAAHIQEEEQCLAELKQRTNNEMLGTLYDELLLAKTTAPIHPHPEAPDRPELGATVIQPIIGQSDRMVDDLVDYTTLM